MRRDHMGSLGECVTASGGKGLFSVGMGERAGEHDVEVRLRSTGVLCQIINSQFHDISVTSGVPQSSEAGTARPTSFETLQ